MHAIGFFRRYFLVLTMTFAWRSLTTGMLFPLVFYVEKLFPPVVVWDLRKLTH